MYKIDSFNPDNIIKNPGPDQICICPGPGNVLYEEYLKWLEEGNTPLPPDPISEPEPLTPQQKLEAAGLSIEELKELLGL
jgi:hypothetical protein